MAIDGSCAMTAPLGADAIAAMTAIATAESLFAEAPVWQDDGLFWIDCARRTICRYDLVSGQISNVSVDGSKRPLGMVAARGGGLVLIDAHGLSLIDPHAGRASRLIAFGGHIGKPNDGKCDRQGRLWFGASGCEGVGRSGIVVRVDSDLSLTVIDSGLQSANGPAFSSDGKTMYIADSSAATIFAYVLRDNGGVAPREVFAQFRPEDGVPDGMTVDSDDHLWVAHYDGARISRFRPDGTVEREIPMPVPRITSVVFGGADLRTLYVTSASVEWPNDGERISDPSASPCDLFEIDTGCSGQAETAFCGSTPLPR